jgi:hypothetical protein
VEFNLNDILNYAVYVSGFRGEDGGIMESNAVSLVGTVFGYGRLVRILLSDVPLMLL